LAGDQFAAETYSRTSSILGGNDFITGGSGADTIAGDQGTAITHGTDSDIGPQFAFPFEYSDIINGGSGDDEIVGDQFLAATYGTGGDIPGTRDSIAGGDGSDRIAGDQGTALMFGGFSYYFFSSGIVGGDDVIDGGKGADTIAGDQFYAHTTGAGIDI